MRKKSDDHIGGRSDLNPYIRAEKLICDVQRDIDFSASLESNAAS